MRRVNASTFWRRHGRDISFFRHLRDYLFLISSVPIFAFLVVEESSEDELTLLRRLHRLSSESELGGLSLGERLCPSLLGHLQTSPDYHGVVKVARCRPSCLDCRWLYGYVPRGGPIAVKTRSYGALMALQRAA
ncbi:hypothetical protein Tco_0500790 [Tanacetum coccineum]|uniref:Uncharacterized protein n=1 Tax=Tanacetum coccineum TaxID=301880 RepID=A0ABQ5J3W8_9ASTR